MNNLLMKVYRRLLDLKDDSGQDLVEYALAVALIAFAAVIGMDALATGINDAFVAIATVLNLYL